LPAIFVIGPDGAITHRFSTGDYRDRPDPTLVYERLRRDTGG